jgi:hypothetical protein
MAIKITIERIGSPEKNEQTKIYTSNFEGGLSEFKKIQDGVDKVVDSILWEYAGNKHESKKAI